jgi:aldose sugar dehydrogenase
MQGKEAGGIEDMRTLQPWTRSLVLALPLAAVAALVLAQPEPTAEPRDAEGWKAVEVADGMEHPWGIAWLPDGSALITARPGTLHLFDGEDVTEVPLDGLPPVFAENQGGLLDVALHPDGQRVYMTMATGEEEANRTILVRGRFDGTRVHGIETIFEVEPSKSEGQHFGSRLLWLPDGTLLMSVGDGGNPPLEIDGRLARAHGQHLGSHLGSIVRLTEDGEPAPDNPFVGRQDARAEIWSYGHRNIQGLARDPDSGRVWATEHGPYGGDELNLIERGENYGWPLQTLGRDYRTREPIGVESAEGMVDPTVVWTPAHAPSGLAYYTGDRYPDWRGSLFSGGLASEDVRRIALDASGQVTMQERIPVGERVRAVSQGPDGHLYLLTDEEDGKLMRIERE